MKVYGRLREVGAIVVANGKLIINMDNILMQGM